MTNSVSYQNQYNDNTSIYKALEEDPMLKAMGISPDMLIKTAAATPFLYGADIFINSKMAENGDKSWLKRIADWGDKMSKKYPNLEKRMDKFNNFISENRFFKYFTSDYSTKPTNKLAKYGHPPVQAGDPALPC